MVNVSSKPVKGVFKSFSHADRDFPVPPRTMPLCKAKVRTQPSQTHTHRSLGTEIVNQFLDPQVAVEWPIWHNSLFVFNGHLSISKHPVHDLESLASPHPIWEVAATLVSVGLLHVVLEFKRTHSPPSFQKNGSPINMFFGSASTPWSLISSAWFSTSSHCATNCFARSI